MADPTPAAADDRFGDWTDDNIVIVKPGRAAAGAVDAFLFDPEKHERDEKGRWAPIGGTGSQSPDTGDSMTLPDGYGTTRDGLPVLPDSKARPNMMTGPMPHEGTATEAAKLAFDGYQEQAGTYTRINGQLRAGGLPDADAAEMTKFIDEYHTVKRDTTVYRAVDAAKFPMRDGLRWTDKGFTSADTDGGGAKEWPVENRALLAIHIPAGTRAMAVSEPPVGGSAIGSRELIIQRGSTFQVERELPQTENPARKQAQQLFEPGFAGGVWHVSLVDQRRDDLAPYLAGAARRFAAASPAGGHAARYCDWDTGNVVVEARTASASTRSVLGLGHFAS